MTDPKTQPASETSDPSQPGLKSHNASILRAACDASQIQRTSLERTCRKSSGSHSALSIVASSRQYTIERQQAVKKPWQLPEVEASQPL
jgi:hypothetical protein